MDTYTTISGDTWDLVARKAYGNELLAGHLMLLRENMPLIDIQVFPSGVTVHTPDLTEEEAYNNDLPDWRKDV